MTFKKLSNTKYELNEKYEFNYEVDKIVKEISGNDIKYSDVLTLTLKEHIGSRILTREFVKQYPNIDYESYPFITIIADLNGTDRLFTLGQITENKEIKYMNGVLTL